MSSIKNPTESQEEEKGDEESQAVEMVGEGEIDHQGKGIDAVGKSTIVYSASPRIAAKVKILNVIQPRQQK